MYCYNPVFSLTIICYTSYVFCVPPAGKLGSYWRKQNPAFLITEIVGEYSDMFRYDSSDDTLLEHYYTNYN